MTSGQPLQDKFLHFLRQTKTPIAVFLVNGIKLQGHIENFDEKVIILDNTVKQMVYKRAISTVVPNRQIAVDEYDVAPDPR